MGNRNKCLPCFSESLLTWPPWLCLSRIWGIFLQMQHLPPRLTKAWRRKDLSPACCSWSGSPRFWQWNSLFFFLVFLAELVRMVMSGWRGRTLKFLSSFLFLLIFFYAFSFLSTHVKLSMNLSCYFNLRSAFTPPPPQIKSSGHNIDLISLSALDKTLNKCLKPFRKHHLCH